MDTETATVTKTPKAPKGVMATNPHKAAVAADGLISAFAWRDSREGQKFWRSVYNRLYGIAHGDPIA